MKCTVEIISIGNELLIGKIANTNAQWLARRVLSLGGCVKRISVVGDSVHEISSILKSSLSRTPSLIITTGGLGPTYDDLTLNAIARTLKAPLKINLEALKMVKEKYRQYEVTYDKQIKLTPARLKMANLPTGAKPLRNPIGTAPGVLLITGKSKIISLPGVPEEMQSIFDDSVKQILSDLANDNFIFEKSMNVTGIMESTLAPLIDEVIFENPYVYIKSHPKSKESQPLIEIHLMTTSNSRIISKKRVDSVSEKISKLILKHGGKISDLITS